MKLADLDPLFPHLQSIVDLFIPTEDWSALMKETFAAQQNSIMAAAMAQQQNSIMAAAMAQQQQWNNRPPMEPIRADDFVWTNPRYPKAGFRFHRLPTLEERVRALEEAGRAH